MNNRGQIDIGVVSFIAVVIVIIILAPILFNIVTTITGTVGDQINATDSTAGQAMYSIKEKFVSFWDIVIILLFGLNVVLLLISAFLAPTHPLFIVLYIIFAFITVVFAPNLIDVVQKVYTQYYTLQPEMSTKLAMTEFLIDNFSLILLGVIVLSGVIMYARIRYSQDG